MVSKEFSHPFLLALICCCTLLADATAATHNVKFSGGVEKKFTHLDIVLDKLIDTMSQDKLWDQSVWNSRVSGTGKTGLTNYKLKDIVAEFKIYLTNGKLTLNYRPDPKATNLRAAGSTTKDRISLNNGAGSWEDGGKTYSDYQLARTIFHELMHDFQHYKWWSTGEYIPLTWDKETVAYKVEGYLPKTLFDAEQHKDPGGSEPVPNKTETWRKIIGVWRTDSGRKIRIYEAGDEIVGTFEGLGDLADYRIATGDFIFDQGKQAGPDRVKGRYFSYALKSQKLAAGEKPYGYTSITMTVSPDGKQLIDEHDRAQWSNETGFKLAETTEKARFVFKRVQ